MLVLTFSQFSYSFPQTASDNGNKPRVIASAKAYLISIQTNDNKQLVALANYVQPLITEWKYATIDNFTKHILYKKPDAYVRLPVAQALQKIEVELAAKGLGLKFYDAYRPYSVTAEMWKVVPDERYAANPNKGSGHNRGAAVDVSLVNLASKEELLMPTKFDDFTERAHHSYTNLSKDVLVNRQLLKSVMEKYGFVALETEWWHYSLPNASAQFELLDLSFKLLKRIIKN